MMDFYLQISLLVIVVIVSYLLFFEPWLKRRRVRVINVSEMNEALSPVHHLEKIEPSCAIKLPLTDELNAAAQKTSVAPDFLALSVFAKQNTQFASYDLLQAISATGMQFGDMNIFHYYSPTDETQRVWFSLASATKPGDFQLDKMGGFSCVGLTLFMDLNNVPHAETAFNKMLETAEQLADDLEGELYASPRRLLTRDVIQEYQNRIKGR